VNPLRPAAVGPLLSWTAAHEPESLARARWALQPKDWLRAQLTGSYRAEPTDASATLLYDFLAEGWSGEAVRRLGLDPTRLPEILPGAGHQAGLLTRPGTDLIGLPIGTPVAAGAARVTAAALGAGVADGNCAQVVLGPRPYVVASISALPSRLPVTGDVQIRRAATDRGWCVTASMVDGGEPAVAIAGAVRAVSALAPVSRIQVPATAHPGLLAALADLVDRPVHAVDAPEPAARAAALLGARAAGLLNEETLRAQFVPRTPVEDRFEAKDIHS
jgi:xylulokinase